jgi:phosphate:Na+ symporter
MDLFSVFTMLGGLALFLYGMTMMGASLEKLSGNRLERLIENLTASPLKAVCLGAGVTAVIQSSSATTVMVVGFVNSGIMKLSQAIGIIMGANVGTTITSWLLSLTGIESSNFFIKLFKPSSFSPILAFIGIILIMNSNSEKDKNKHIGETMVGFAILMFGMSAMSGAVKPLAEVEGFTNLLVMFQNPILGILVGALLTAVIQSSSASVGVLQALSLTGAFSYSAVIPIIMGQNIGTCVTAMISAIGANRNARRTAFVHLYFNLIGTLLFMAIYFGINALIGFSFANQTIYPFGIAIVHTVFNIFTTLALLPFTKFLEKLAYLTLPLTEVEKNKSTEFALLDNRFLSTPTFALEQAYSVTFKMSVKTKEQIMMAIDLINDYNPEKVEKLEKLELVVNDYDTRLKSYLMRISSENLNNRDSRAVSIIQHIIIDLERIGDHSINILKINRGMNKHGYVFSDIASEHVDTYQKALVEILELTSITIYDKDADTAKTVEALEEVIDIINKKVKKDHLRRLRKGTCTVEVGLYLADLCNNYERVGDHCANIAVSILQLHQDDVDSHSYVDKLLSEEDPEFEDRFNFYKEKYKL